MHGLTGSMVTVTVTPVCGGGWRASEARNEPTECDSRQREIGAVPNRSEQVTPRERAVRARERA